MSISDRWLRIKDLFRRYPLQPQAEREQWLRDQCAGDQDLLREVRDLLAAHDASADLLEDGAFGLIRRMHNTAPAADLIGRRIGAYRLVKLLGEGGMGTVYLAERDDGDFMQQVALKLVRSDFVDADMHARFVRERNFLAGLSHPHIAQLHDGGVADGVPYFTLEYVEGEPITRFCDARNWNLRQRVQLMLQVCAAVTYAHRNLIVHRDLKPSNILVTRDGEAKLLDFGIAKLVDPQSQAGQTATQARLMTPEYAAPEQVLGGKITTATDVYAIGVLLYELLSGRLPYARADAGALSWPQAVVEEGPEPIARALNRTTGRRETLAADAIAAHRGTTLPNLRRALRGDLERIVQRALAKEPDARYASVAELADDLHAFVDGRAISGGSRRYQLRMFVRRHWLPLSATALIVLILLASGAAIVWQSRQIAREAQNTLQVKDFLFGLFTAVDPNLAKGRTLTANELVDRGAERIRSDKTLDAEQKAEIEATLGQIYYKLGAYVQADNLQDSAISALRPSTALRARTQRERAETLTEIGDLKSASALAETARMNTEALRDASLADRAAVAHAQSRIALAQRDFAQARLYAQRELAFAQQIPDASPRIVFGALMTAGAASWGLQQFDEAAAKWREAAATVTPIADPEDMDLAKARQNLAMAMQSKSLYAQAAELEQQALTAYEKVLGADHPLTLSVKGDLGLAQYRLGFYAQARTMLEEVIAAQRRKFGGDHPAIAGTEINLCLLLTDSGDADAAERVLSEAVSIFEKKYGRDYQGVRLALGDLAAAHIAQGKLDQAQAELSEVLEREQKAGTPPLGDYIDTYRLGDIKRRQGDFKTALELQRAALGASQKEHGENHRLTANAHHFLALSLRDSGNIEGAERELRAALTGYPTAEPPFIATVKTELGGLLLRRADSRSEGIDMLTSAVQLREQFLGADNPLTEQARLALSQARAPTKS